MKRCKQCGELRVETMFRVYYNGRKGTYPTCLVCEKTNTRYKYLLKKIHSNACKDFWSNPDIIAKVLTASQLVEFNKIEELYGLLRDKGLKPPMFGTGHKSSILVEIDAQLEKHKEDVQNLQTVVESTGVKIDSTTPAELTDWLTKDLKEFTPEQLDNVYSELCNKYRPCTGLDKSLCRTYDETYYEVLDKILERFDDYEEVWDNENR